MSDNLAEEPVYKNAGNELNEIVDFNLEGEGSGDSNFNNCHTSTYVIKSDVNDNTKRNPAIVTIENNNDVVMTEDLLECRLNDSCQNYKTEELDEFVDDLIQSSILPEIDTNTVINEPTENVSEDIVNSINDPLDIYPKDEVNTTNNKSMGESLDTPSLAESSNKNDAPVLEAAVLGFVDNTITNLKASPSDIPEPPVLLECPVSPINPENFVDILGNNLLTKQIISKGLGRETRPTHGDSVTIQYKAWNSRDELFKDATETFVLGDGDMIQAFDLALCLAEKHECFELKTDARFAYGALGLLPDIEPNETLKYHIKLLSVDDTPDYSTYSYENRILAVDQKRERGNYLYRREEFSYAVNSYSRAIKIIETDPDFKKVATDPSKADLYELFVKVTNNLAASQLKLESFDSVIETCNTILNYDRQNVKALFRKGKSLSMKGCFDEAIVILKRAFELDNKNKLIATEIQRCIQLKRAEDEQRARICRRMFPASTKSEPASVHKSTVASWKKTFYKYSPYVGAVVGAALSVFLATVAISKSKGN